jgi:hypothetical protein
VLHQMQPLSVSCAFLIQVQQWKTCRWCEHTDTK